MTVARTQLVDASVTRWYYCEIRCVRGAELLGAGPHDRKGWIENRLGALAQIFAVSVGGFAVEDSYLHLLLRLDPDVANRWSNADVVRRWGLLCPPRDKSRQPLPVSKGWVRSQAADVALVATARDRLQNLGWFMKSLTEPLARLANRQDHKRGSFFEGRYKTVAILDEESLLAACVYIDLIALVGGIADAPEVRPYTSIKTRVKHAASGRRTRSSRHADDQGAGRPSKLVESDQSLWLCPIEAGRKSRSAREGMFEGVPLSRYRLLVDYTGRLLREGIAPFPSELSGLFDRLGMSSESWSSLMETLIRRRPYGRFLTTSHERLREAAAALGVVRIANVGGPPRR